MWIRNGNKSKQNQLFGKPVPPRDDLLSAVGINPLSPELNPIYYLLALLA
jgi:transposase